MRDMTWNVYIGNMNSGNIEVYNIFQHGGFLDDVKTIYKKHKNEYDIFCEKVKRSLGYYFWSKCEWEVVVDHWPPSDKKDRYKPRKIDVYNQVMLNWDVFINYVWEMTHARKITKNKKEMEKSV